MYLITIQNIVKNYVKQRKASGTQHGDGPDNKTRCNWDNSALLTMFDTVKHLLLQVSVFDMAVMCASWTAKELPMGKNLTKISSARFLDLPCKLLNAN